MEDRREREATMPFDEWINDYIDRALEDYQDQDVYACDLAYKLCEAPNVDGSYTYSTYWAKEFIKNHFEECSEYSEYEKFNFGETLHNSFDNPEAFQVCMLIWGVENNLNELEFINDNWNERITLDNKTIKNIRKELGIC